MLKANYRKVGQSLDNKVGGITNESRFAEPDETRLHKKFTLPALGTGGLCYIEQGWNKKAKSKDVVKMTMVFGDDEIEMVFRRIDLEQCIFAMAQGDETLKYIREEARAQRKYAERN